MSRVTPSPSPGSPLPWPPSAPKPASPLPWRTGRSDMISYVFDSDEPFANVYGQETEPHPRTSQPVPVVVARVVGYECQADAAYIIEACNAYPELRAAANRLPELEAEVERLRITVDVLRGDACEQERSMGNGGCGLCPRCAKDARDERDAARAESAELREALRTLRDIAVDMRTYTPDWASEKWGHDEAIRHAQAVLARHDATEADDER